MALKLRIERMLCDGTVHWVARLIVEGKHVGTLDFDEIELGDQDITVQCEEEEE